MTKNDQQTYLALALITALGAGLRFYHLNANSFWLDEMATWYYSASPTLSEWAHRFFTSLEPFPGTYYFLNFLWAKAFGTTEWAFRAFSALAGVLAIPAIFLFGRNIAGARVGLLAAAFTAIGWSPVFFSQDARPYSLIFLFSALLCASTLGLLKEKNRTNEALFLLSAIALTQLHYFGVFLFGLSAAFLLVNSLIEKKWPAKILWWSSGIAFVLFLPWLARMISQLGFSPANANIRQRSLWKTFTSFYKFCFFTDDKPSFPPLLAFYWITIGLLLFLVWHVWRSRRRDFWMLLGWLVIPFLALWIKSEISQPAYRARYLVISLPAAITAMALSLGIIFRSRPRLFAAIGAVFCVLFASHAFLEFDYYGEARRRTIGHSFAHVSDAVAKGEDMRVVTCSAGSKYLGYYIERYPNLSSRWESKEDCGLEAHNENKPLAVIFHIKEPVENYVSQMQALGWKLGRHNVAADHSIFIFRP